MKLNSQKKYEDWDYVEEDPTSSDESTSERKNLKRESVELLVRGKECTLINHNCSIESFKDVLYGSDASIIDISNGLIPTVSKREKGKLSEMKQQLKKAGTAQRRKIQSEKAAREAVAAAIRKILSQESGRKKREERMNKRRDEFAKEKSSKSFNLGSNTVRLTMGPHGTVVTFSEDIGLPSIFQMRPNSYPPRREKCAGPNCTNVYKYRHSKSKLPLCSLGCYRAIHEKIQLVVACYAL
ncbi:Ino80 complex [Spatholobus suberectus]|nr:Ino80 complex [Spatholobus suberectus]